MMSLCISLITLNDGAAQPDDTYVVTFRGIQFDPLELEAAAPEDLEVIGLTPEAACDATDPDDARWRVLQFAETLNRASRRQLWAAGLGLDFYVGGAYIEKVTPKTVQELRDAGLLRACVPYYREFKLAPSLRGGRLHEDRRFKAKDRAAIQGLLLRATVFGESNLDDVADTIRAAGAEDVLLQDSSSVGGPRRAVFRLGEDKDRITKSLALVVGIDGIRSIEEVGEVVPLNAKTAATNQSGNSNNPTIWDRNIAGEGQIISVVDFGIPEIDHCLLRDGNVPGNTPGIAHRKILDIRDQSEHYPYGADHATFVAASAAGDHVDEPGTHDQRGGAWAARLFYTNVFEFAQVLPPSTLPIELAAASELANIHSNSWLERPGGYSDFAEDFDDFAWRNEDHVVVAAAAIDSVPWGAPAIAKNSLTVSAATADTTSIDNGKASYPTPGRTKPDIAAVGCGISSADPSSSCGVTSGNCATSYATPHVSALAALTRQYYLDGWFPGGPTNPTGALLKATLINSARDMPMVAGYPNSLEGWGMVAIDRTLSFADSEHNLWIKDVRNSDADALDTDEMREYLLNVPDNGQPIKITLVWMDAPDLAHNGFRINDLDLEVESPGGASKYLGNVFDSANGMSASGGTKDSKNNVEQVFVDSPDAGEWTVRVLARSIDVVEIGKQGQGYALVATMGKGTRLLAGDTSKHPPFDISKILMIIIILMFLIGLGIIVAPPKWKKPTPSGSPPDS
jgi:hypothetical protein